MRIDQLTKLTGRPVEDAPLPLTAAYPRAGVHVEVGKAVAGIVCCVAFVAGVQPSPWLGVPVLGMALAFGAYLWQQTGRYSFRLRVDENGVARTQRGRSFTLPWASLSDFRLNYYPNGRKARTGTLVVVLWGGGRTGAGGGRHRIKADSALDHFPALLSRAARAAHERELVLHPTTVANLEKLEL